MQAVASTLPAKSTLTYSHTPTQLHSRHFWYRTNW